MYVCLWSPAWSTAGASGAEAGASGAPDASHEVAPLLAEEAPRLRVEAERIWADGRGLDAGVLARRLVVLLEEVGVEARAGVAAIPVTAELAARWGHRAADPEGPVPFLVKERTGWGQRAESGARSQEPGIRNRGIVVVPSGEEAAWQASLPVAALGLDGRVLALLDGVGVTTVGELAALEREAVEVRFGGAAVAHWRRARADDPRPLFRRIPPERPHASVDFVDYVLTDPARLLFTANALLGPLCRRLVERGEHARTLHLELPLANGETWERTLRPARPTASRDTWLRLLRGLLDRLTVPDAVAGMRLEVPSTEAAAVRQGDLFDRGFATASAVEAAVARLAELRVWPLAPETDAHPLVERRGRWARQGPSKADPLTPRGEAGQGSPPRGGAEGGGLSLQLLPEPRRIVVETATRRDHQVPVRIRDGRWREVVLATGPDRVSGGQWEEAYAREYYRCVTEDGMLWVYRDGLGEGWYLHGWWD